MSSVKSNERTEAAEAEELIKPEIPGEQNTEPHSTPTENGSDHPGPSTGESTFTNDNVNLFIFWCPTRHLKNEKEKRQFF